MTETIDVIVQRIKLECEGTLSIRLSRTDGGALPPFTPGSHVDVHIDNNMIRSYSIYSRPAEKQYYEIAVSLSPDSRGGSEYIHKKMKCGDVLKIGHPRNLFSPDGSNDKKVLIAGGIGITPIVSIAQHFKDMGCNWEMHYFCRNSNRVALKDRIQKLEGNVITHIPSEGNTNPENTLKEIIKNDGVTHYYCCGPKAMLDDFIEITKDFNPELVHFERFSAANEVCNENEYNVILEKSNMSLRVSEGETILDVLLKNKLDIMHSCCEGICGACEVPVLKGDIDHRDSILSDDEKEENLTMFVCCSGSKGGDISLDL